MLQAETDSNKSFNVTNCSHQLIHTPLDIKRIYLSIYLNAVLHHIQVYFIWKRLCYAWKKSSRAWEKPMTICCLLPGPHMYGHTGITWRRDEHNSCLTGKWVTQWTTSEPLSSSLSIQSSLITSLSHSFRYSKSTCTTQQWQKLQGHPNLWDDNWTFMYTSPN